MSLYKNDKNKGKLNFLNFTKKINDNDFLSFTFYKKSYNTFLLTIIMFKHGKLESILTVCVRN